MALNRRKFLTVSGLGSAGALLARPSQERRPNILFVFADQLRSMELGCYGGTQVETPNMDRLAAEGTLFTNAISTAPVCSPYRAMLLTGNFPMKNGMVLNDHRMRNPTPFFAEVCKSSGYQTAYIGKWHVDGHGRDAYIPPERRRGFDFWRTLECTHSYLQSAYYHQDEKKSRLWPQYDAIAQTDTACDYITQHDGEKPFCLFLSWGPPHDPYIAPQKYMERFDAARVELRANVNDYQAAEKMRNECDTMLPENMRKTREQYTRFLADQSNAMIRKWYAGYFAAIETLDDCLGRVLATLERKGELNNTIVVFTSDHGDNLGSHRQYAKQLPYEESISVPFLLRYPRKVKAGAKSDGLLAPVDIMPTLFALAGIQPPAVDGRDLSAAAAGADDAREAVLIMRYIWLGTNWITNGSGPWRGVRTKRYTYARKSHTKTPWLLFDNLKDPQQLTNLVDEPASAELLKRLDQRTDELLAEAGDPEEPVAIAKMVIEEQRRYGMAVRSDVLLPRMVAPGAGWETKSEG